ncbi:MAG: hypothetical protein A2W31_06770 [Planctomycetes bacterium RBG_16_64_10]|nr:MAG: hypothetical protein A2W31_06770 [Planctomycetes bacterium RBG_16_64_10]
MDSKLTAMMVDDFLHDPVLAAKVVLGITCPPHMEVRLWSMWTKLLTIDNSGFGSGKSLATAIVSTLRAILMRGRTEAIMGPTFAQGQLAHKYIDLWIDTKPIVRSQCIFDPRMGLPSRAHSSQAWEARFKSGSVVRTIPPDFKGGGERAGSEDWTDACFDEVTKMPDMQIFFRQFVTRVRKPIPEEYAPVCTTMTRNEDPIFGQHIYMGGTPRYVWHPFYKSVESAQRRIQNGSTTDDVLSFNHKDIERFFPEHPEYRDFVNLKRIKLIEEGLPRDVAQQEIYGFWVKDSSGYYSQADIDAARVEPAPILLGRE